MARTVRTIRRSIRAALTAGRRLVTAGRGARFGVLVALYAALTAGPPCGSGTGTPPGSSPSGPSARTGSMSPPPRRPP